ncbi:MarR family winged helix-turn-helix transcriptional regulator [Stappia stellulata]|uniref:MarR family winged helix-turn-helix transcriptional regulator n=1 Tax=Stappia stellulata TaxID=71235 RepID=UPI0004223B03|nr:MarR family winged helix-turn-helix transcriptional regulator [Stappia stellulata]
MTRSGPEAGKTSADGVSAPLDHGCLDELVGHLLRHAFLRGHQVFAEVFDGDSLTPLQFMVLELVDRNPGVTHREVAAVMSCAPSVLTTALKPLVASGALLREGVAGDGRRAAYRLSRDGRSWFQDLRPKISRAESELLSGLEETDQATLRDMLRRIAGRSGGRPV